MARRLTPRRDSAPGHGRWETSLQTIGCMWVAVLGWPGAFAFSGVSGGGHGLEPNVRGRFVGFPDRGVTAGHRRTAVRLLGSA